jgi:magnesium transporter
VNPGGGRRRRPPYRRPAASARKIGLSPGTVVYTGTEPPGEVGVDLIVYGEDGFEHRRGAGIEAALAGIGDGRVRWIDVTGLHDTPMLERIGAALGLHPLTLEDVASVAQRPKVERFDTYHYVVMRMITLVPSADVVPVLREEQLSIVLVGDVVVTFKERPGDVLDTLRTRIGQDRGRARRLGADYLAYAIVDLVVDHYFAVLEAISDALEAFEVRAFEAPDHATVDGVQAVKRELLHLRRAIWPTRELLASLARDEEEGAISSPVRTYLRDAHDHAVAVLETVEMLRETASAVHETYLAALSLRTNDVMRLLTIIATVFIPLTFVVGVYGMNFEHMPELGWRWGYAAVWAVMLVAVALMLLMFRRRRWI